MKLFKSFLAPELDAFIVYRKGLGYDTRTIRSMLSIFDRYISDQPDPSAVWQPFFYLKLRNEIGLGPSSVNSLLYAARCFLDYMRRKQALPNNPIKDVPCLPRQAFIPFVFSPEQVDQLLDTVCRRIRKSPRYFIKDLSEYLVFVLLARCGMRINEPLRLKIKDYRPEEKTLYIEKTKFKKDRLIPIPIAAAEAIENYLSIRQQWTEYTANPYLFIGGKQKRLGDQRIRYVFHNMLSLNAIHRSRRLIGNTIFGNPTPHSLRHSFAVNTLNAAVARGESAQNVLPVLAAYMGHVEYRHTMKYLKVIDAESGASLLNFAGTQREKV